MDTRRSVALGVAAVALLCAAGCLVAASPRSPLEAGATFAAFATTTTTNTWTTIVATTTTWSDGNGVVASPRGFKADPGTCGSGIIVVSWRAPQTSDDYAHFTYSLSRNGAEIYNGDSTSFTDTGLQANESYTYSMFVNVASSWGTRSSSAVSLTAHAPHACANNDSNGSATTTTATTTTTGGTSDTASTSTNGTTDSTVTASTTTVVSSSSPAGSDVDWTGPTVGPHPVATPIVTATPIVDTPAPITVTPPSEVRDLPIATTTSAPAPPPPEVIARAAVLDRTITSFLSTQASADTTKDKLIALVNSTIDKAVKRHAEKKDELEALRTSLIAKISKHFDSPETVATGDSSQIATDVGATLAGLPDAESDVASTASGLATSVAASPEVALLYKDSNKDGISDYDAVHVFSMDPKAAAPTTVVGKKVYTPEAKALAGYDPSKKNLVRIFPQDPTSSTLSPTKAYTVDHVALSAASSLAFSGKALPNSFITIYIFSTPIVVTVKTSADGTWNYTLDRELENGLHTVETATVDNTGHILAKSQPFPFTKTAQAATLDALPLPADEAKPALLSGTNFYIAFGLSTLIFLLALIYVGVDARRRQALAMGENNPPAA